MKETRVLPVLQPRRSWGGTFLSFRDESLRPDVGSGVSPGSDSRTLRAVDPKVHSRDESRKRFVPTLTPRGSLDTVPDPWDRGRGDVPPSFLL